MKDMSKSKWIASMVTCALIGSVAGSVGLSFADNLASTSTVLNEGVIVPYDGYLMLDSAPVNAAAQNLRFSLYESPTGGTAQWVETQTVSVNGGKFSVALGKGTKVSSTPPNASFDAVILDAQKLYIGIEVDDGAGMFIELAGRQAIEAAPFAAWAAKSADFEVARDLTVQRNTQINGGLGVTGAVNTGSSLAVGSTLNVGGNTTMTGRLTVNNRTNLTGAVDVNGTLAVNSTTSLGSNLNVSGNSNVLGTSLVSGRLTANDGITLGNDKSITGADIIQGFNDLRFYGDPSVGSADLYIAANGNVSIPQLTSWPTGNYCILRNGGSCPSGFTAANAYVDAEDDGNTSTTSGNIGASNNSSNGIRLQFCCK